MIEAIRDPNPVVFIDDRWLHNIEDVVPEEVYGVEIGKGVVRREGKGITLIAASFMAHESMKAVQELEKEGIDVEFIDPRTVKPIDQDLILKSVMKTGRLLVVDGGWKTCGLAAEISAMVSESVFEYLKAPIKRLTLPDCPAPASAELEKEFYKYSGDVVEAVKQVVRF